ncbi:MAG: hypothetical protein ACRD16_13615 [Thermoanaerobaculia bacterium]
MPRRALAPAAALLLFAGACNLQVFSNPKRPSRDGYRAIFVSTDGRRTPIAARPGRRRIEEGPLVRILKLPEKTTILFRTDRKLFLEAPTWPEDAIAPGYELDAPFDPGRSFPGREVFELGDDVQAGHVCALLRVWSSETDSAVSWVAKDLDRLLVRIQWQRVEAGEFKNVKTEELLGVRPGADESLFRAPEGFRRASSREDLRK